MTSLIDNNIDELIKRVRKKPAVSDMVFMSAYPSREIPNPVTKYTVTAANRGVKKSRVFIGDAVGEGLTGSLYEVAVTLRTYAPRHSSTPALLRMTSLLYDAVEACDEDGAIVSAALGEIAFENSIRCYYRDLYLTLRWLLSGEGAR